jgi:hypothetical protein
MADQIFFHEQYGPYQQLAQIKVDDSGNNGLPIYLAMVTGDPYRATNNSMTISQAKRYRDKLTEAIDTAIAAGIRDAGI